MYGSHIPIVVGVNKVEQGWISSEAPNDRLSEGVVVHFDEQQIELAVLIAIHLYTHSCTSEHSMRSKYRSAVYTFTPSQVSMASQAIEELQREFDQPIVTKVLPFDSFQLNKKSYLDYYYRNPDKPFCQHYIDPKLKLLYKKFRRYLST